MNITRSIVAAVYVLTLCSQGPAQVPETAIERAKRHEGMVLNAYLDTSSNVTIGIGRLIPNEMAFKKLKFIRKSDGMDASESDKSKEWAALKILKPGQLPSYYEQNTSLKVEAQEVRRWLSEDLSSTVEELKREFPEFDDYPPSAKTGLIEMGFNLGVPNLPRKFPTFTAAAKRKDWLKCEKECTRRPPISACRNEETQRLFNLASSGD